MSTHDDTECRLVSNTVGRFYENFEIGDIYIRRYRRTFTVTDNVRLTNLLIHLNLMESDGAYAAETEFGQRIVNWVVIFAIVVVMTASGVRQNAMANLVYRDVRQYDPVYRGDLLFFESLVSPEEDSESRNPVGMVANELRAYKQEAMRVLPLEDTPNISELEHAGQRADRPLIWNNGVQIIKEGV